MTKPKTAATPQVTHRMTDLRFPTDPYAFSHRFKKEALAAIYRVRGHAEKKRILDDVFKILLAFAEAKYEYDRKARTEAVEAAEPEDETDTTETKTDTDKAAEDLADELFQ